MRNGTNCMKRLPVYDTRCCLVLCQLDFGQRFSTQSYPVALYSTLQFCLAGQAEWNRSEISKGTMRLNSYLLKSTLVASLGGLLFGFDTAVIAGTTHALTDTFHLTPSAFVMTVSPSLWVTILGSILAGP